MCNRVKPGVEFGHILGIKEGSALPEDGRFGYRVGEAACGGIEVLHANVSFKATAMDRESILWVGSSSHK